MESIWNSIQSDEEITSKKHKASKHFFPEGFETEVAVVGGGIAGILTAYYLKSYGLRTVVLEAETVGSGVTSGTTAKITYGHNFIYKRLIDEIGIELTRQYSLSNQLALKQYRDLIEKLEIDCDYEELPMYVYSLKDTELVKAEIEAASSVYLDAEFAVDIEIPVLTRGAVRYPNQAQFNPLKFLNYISGDLEIYEHTLVTKINGHTLHTSSGTLHAKHIVIASHYPFINIPGFYFMKMYQSRSYALALKNVPELNAMYTDGIAGGYSYRSFKDYLIFSGNGHRTGQNLNGGYYQILREAIADSYPLAKEVMHWSAQDCMTLDGIPYIGQYSVYKPYLYVATGFGKWGMTSSMVAAMLLTDAITGESNPFAEVYSPKRLNIKASKQNFHDHLKCSFHNLITQNLEKPVMTLDALPNDHGAIIDNGNTHLGAYRDENGDVFLVPAKCPHMGCALTWNPDDKTWDCPCHGTRLDYKGNILENPAIHK